MFLNSNLLSLSFCVLCGVNWGSSHWESLVQVQSEGRWDWSRLKTWLGRKLKMFTHGLGSRCWISGWSSARAANYSSSPWPRRVHSEGESPRVSVLRSPARSWKSANEWASEVPVSSAVFCWSPKLPSPAHIEERGSIPWCVKQEAHSARKGTVVADVLEAAPLSTILGKFF